MERPSLFLPNSEAMAHMENALETMPRYAPGRQPGQPFEVNTLKDRSEILCAETSTTCSVTHPCSCGTTSKTPRLSTSTRDQKNIKNFLTDALWNMLLQRGLDRLRHSSETCRIYRGRRQRPCEDSTTFTIIVRQSSDDHTRPPVAR